MRRTEKRLRSGARITGPHGVATRMVLAGLVALGLGADRLPAQVDRCDELAASGLDENAVAPGVEVGAIDGEAAVAACSAAVGRVPDVARFHFQLGRALTRLRRFDEAVQSYRRALELAPEYVAAAVNLGVAHRYGQGVPQDFHEAVRLLRLARDHPIAQHHLGDLYVNGEGVEKDEAEGVRWYQKAAKAGLALSQNALGWHYMNGRGIRHDAGRAMELFRRAAKQGNSGAMVNIGLAYVKGTGVERDYAEALAWYRKAEALGHLTAINNIGSLYEDGLGVARDLEQAAAYYRRAAEGGLQWAQQNLDRLYASGQVLPPTPEPLVLERPETGSEASVTPARPTVSSLAVTAHPTTVRLGETVELSLSYVVEAGATGTVTAQHRWTLSFAGQRLPNFPVERETRRTGGEFTTAFSQVIPPGAEPGRYDFRGEVCVEGDCISRTTRFEVVR